MKVIKFEFNKIIQENNRCQVLVFEIVLLHLLFETAVNHGVEISLIADNPSVFSSVSHRTCMSLDHRHY